jgi:hypothetical protein
MRVVFAGPSLAFQPLPGRFEIELRGPAGQGDIAAAVDEGCTVIGLVDGVYEQIAAVWHKEIIYAIEKGVTVFGGASMGALRAAECARFGMTGVGEIFRRYHDGELTDDAAVAQLHAPKEFGYLPLTEALVNAVATVAAVELTSVVSRHETHALLSAAHGLFFKERTHASMAEAATRTEARAEEVERLLDRHRVDLKRRDALMVVNAVGEAPVLRRETRHQRVWWTSALRASLKRARPAQVET